MPKPPLSHSGPAWLPAEFLETYDVYVSNRNRDWRLLVHKNSHSYQLVNKTTNQTIGIKVRGINQALEAAEIIVIEKSSS